MKENKNQEKNNIYQNYLTPSKRNAGNPEFQLKTEKLQKIAREEIKEGQPLSQSKNYIDFNIEYAADKLKQTLEYQEMRRKQKKREEEKTQLTKTILMANDYKVDDKLKNSHNCLIGINKTLEKKNLGSPIIHLLILFFFYKKKEQKARIFYMS